MSEEVFYWKCRLVRSGPWVALKTWFGRPVRDGEEQDRSYRWNALLRTETSSRLVLFGDSTPIEIEDIAVRNIERIEKAEYEYLRDHAAWATEHSPSSPDAAPRTKIDRRGKSVW